MRFPLWPASCLAFVLAKIVELTTVNGVCFGMRVGFAIWLGFVTTLQLTTTRFERKPSKLYLINQVTGWFATP